MTAAATLPSALAGWLAQSAQAIDTGDLDSSEILPQLVSAGLAGVGVPVALGGSGGDVVDAMMAIAAVAEESLAASFMLWGHRSYIEYLLQTPNHALAERNLPELLSGRVAGASGLSNAMKFLAGLEQLQITAERDGDGDGIRLTGKMPWVTNLRPQGFHVAAAIDWQDRKAPAFIAFLAQDDIGLSRSADLELMGMRSSDTAAITLDAVRICADRILAEDANAWLPQVKPAFVGLQCGMSIGLARRALAEAARTAATGRGVLGASIAELRQRLDQAQSNLASGLRTRRFEQQANALFELRIILAEIVAEAVMLELQASGGKAYLSGPGRDFARRWRESAFIPLVTPSLTQMRAALIDQARAA